MLPALLTRRLLTRSTLTLFSLLHVLTIEALYGAWASRHFVLALYVNLSYNSHMKRVTVMLSIPQFQALMALAKQRGLSFSEILRRAIDEYLSRHKDSLS